jgi:hypothetical protein
MLADSLTGDFPYLFFGRENEKLTSTLFIIT